MSHGYCTTINVHFFKSNIKVVSYKLERFQKTLHLASALSSLIEISAHPASFILEAFAEVMVPVLLNAGSNNDIFEF